LKTLTNYWQIYCPKASILAFDRHLLEFLVQMFRGMTIKAHCLQLITRLNLEKSVITLSEKYGFKY